MIPFHLSGQVVIDSFERNLDNWEILIGNANLDGNEFSGASSVRLHRPDQPIGASTIIRHRTFNDNFGIYQMACSASGLVSDIQFLFQYSDDQNYYSVGSNPRGTDNPEFKLWKVVNGTYTVLDSIAAVMDLNIWYRMRVERYCTGEISVYVNDSLFLQAFDREILNPGTICLAAWAENTYFDDMAFQSANSDIVTELTETICSGTFYEVAGNRYSMTGKYADTLQTSDGCDSVVKLDLTISPHYLVNAQDTVCAHEGYILGNDTLYTGGNYNATLKSIYGCDSLVELRLTVIGENILRDTFLCEGQSLLFAGDTIRAPGTYLDTLFAVDGCFSVIQLRVAVQDAVSILGPDQTVCFEETPNLPLRATGFDSILWFDGRTLETIAISAPGVYTVTVFDGDCQLFDTIMITEFCEPKVGVYIPNAFTPNNDNVNDFFQPQFTERPQNYSLKIFNRWGGLMYSSLNEDPGWDGSVNGESVPDGVYVYLIIADGEKMSGTVTLIR